MPGHNIRKRNYFSVSFIFVSSLVTSRHARLTVCGLGLWKQIITTELEKKTKLNSMV
jgi:hypothetical protein